MSALIPKRPGITEEMILVAAHLTAVNTANVEDDMYSKLSEEIAANYRYPMNGYELTKELDLTFSWDCFDLMFVEDMDLMTSHVDEVHRKACWEWVKDSQIKPPYPLGTSTEQGEITGISEFSPATYEVKKPEQNDDEGFSRLLVKFEDAVPVKGGQS